MKRETLLLMLVLMPFLAFAQNETMNETFTNITTPWYQDYLNNMMSGDVITLASILIGLIIVYVIGKVAFKFIKIAIIILAIILALRVIL